MTDMSPEGQRRFQECYTAGQALGRKHRDEYDPRVMDYADWTDKESFIRGYRLEGRMAASTPVHSPCPPGWKGGGHYSINWLDEAFAWAWIREKFGPQAQADEYGLVLFSTSGVHGSYMTLDRVVGDWEGARNMPDPTSITFLCVEPRLVRMTYGNLPLSPSDPDTPMRLSWLRELARSTIKAVEKIQEGNT